MFRLIIAGIFFLAFCSVGITANAATETIVKIPSKKMMNKAWKAAVILPSSYKIRNDQYSVIYLLHGYSQDYSVWTKIADLKKYSDDLQVIFVCPDGNFNSWYLNSPEKPSSIFETYIAEEVPAFIDSVFHTIKSKKGRAIAGSSMGGHGAANIFIKYSEKFAAGASISGILDLTGFPAMWDINSLLGNFETHSEVWQSHSFSEAIGKINTMPDGLIIACGLSDFALECNRQVHKKLMEKNFQHRYIEKDGAHTTVFVQSVFPDIVKYLAGIISAPLPR